MNEDRKYFFDKAEQKVLDFEKTLSKIGIDINNESDLYRIGFQVLKVYNDYENPDQLDNEIDFRPMIRSVMGFNNFIDKIIPLINSEFKSEVVPHLRLLNNSSIPQNTQSRVTDQGANKLFELYIAGLCFPKFTSLRLDSPDHSKGDNPDITFEYESEIWGIACKAIHSFKPKSLEENITKAIDQIEKSSCTKGFVMFNLKNIIDHDEIWPLLDKCYHEHGVPPEYGTFYNIDEPLQMMKSYIPQMFQLLDEKISKKEMLSHFENKKAEPVVVSLLQSSTGIMVNKSPVFTFIGFLGAMPFSHLSEDFLNVLQYLNNRIR